MYKVFAVRCFGGIIIAAIGDLLKRLGVKKKPDDTVNFLKTFNAPVISSSGLEAIKIIHEIGAKLEKGDSKGAQNLIPKAIKLIDFYEYWD